MLLSLKEQMYSISRKCMILMNEILNYFSIFGWNKFNKCKHCTPTEDMTDTLILGQTLSEQFLLIYSNILIAKKRSTLTTVFICRRFPPETHETPLLVSPLIGHSGAQLKNLGFIGEKNVNRFKC